MAGKKKHTALKVLGAATAAGACAYGGLSYYVFRNAFDVQHSSLYSAAAGVRRLASGVGEKNEWYAHSTRDDAFIDSYDGFKLHALRIMNHSDSHRWMIYLHGFGSFSTQMLDYIYEADHNGLNVLAPDSRGCGMSEGQYSGLGWNEHYDLISWINYLISVDPEAEIALFGVTTGGAAVMNATGDYLPSNVKCAIEDSGFSGIKEIIKYQVQKNLKIDGKLVMPGVDFLVKQNLHFSMNDVSTLRQLKQSETPTLFMHGTEDDVIPASMVFDNYYACAAEKELYTADGKGFGETPEASDYFTAVFSFIDRYMPEKA